MNKKGAKAPEKICQKIKDYLEISITLVRANRS